MAEREYIPPSQYQLMRIIREKHPILYMSLKGKILEEQMAAICAYCDLAVDGAFDIDQLEYLMDRCSQILWERAAISLN